MEKIEFLAKQQQSVFEAILDYKKTLNFSILQTALRKKDIRVNNIKINVNVLVKENDLITLYIKQRAKKHIDIVFEDKNVIIAMKPQGVEVTTKDKTFLDSETLEELLNAKACHRLDKNTEGILVLAKNSDAEKSLQEAFKKHNVEKKYVAIVLGKVKSTGENFVDYIKKEQNFAKICQKSDKNSKIAKLSYKLLNKINSDLFLIEISLDTGRMHQIRVQLAHHGIFVLGDEKYGDKQANKKYHTKKQMLCAKEIKFIKLDAPIKYLSKKHFVVTPTFDLNNLVKPI